MQAESHKDEPCWGFHWKWDKCDYNLGIPWSRPLHESGCQWVGWYKINRRAGVLLLTGHDVELVKTPLLQIVVQGVDQAETYRQADEMVIEYFTEWQ
jgi:hypothetical protein